jgi:hypothetical protein
MNARGSIGMQIGIIVREEEEQMCQSFDAEFSNITVLGLRAKRVVSRLSVHHQLQLFLFSQLF